MVIGHGDIASVLPERENILFFASGVSNSKEERESEYRREINLLLEQDKSKHIVYFSSLSVFYSTTRYAEHKREMELLIKGMFETYTIFRIGNITWGSNPHTIINYFKEQKKRGEKLDIQDTYRYVIDQEEFLHWINLIPSWSCEMNCPGRRMSIKQIVEEFVA